MLNQEIDNFLREVLRKKSPTDLDSLIEYERFCRQAEGQSNKTVELVVLALSKLKDFLEQNHLPIEARQIGANDIRRFTLHLQNCRRYADHPLAKAQKGGLSAHSINSYLRAIRAAFNRWVTEGFLEATPFQKVKLPKPSRKIIPTFSEEQLDAFFRAIDTATHEGFRDYTMFLLYLDTMCRLSEVTSAKVGVVNLRERALRVVGKGGHQRVVPFGLVTQKALWKYINLCRPEPAVPNHDYLFLTRDGRRLTKNRVERLMKKYSQKAGIEGVRCSPHTLRHTACKLWISNGGDIFSLQKITGHSSLEVLRGYINLAQGDVNAAHRRYSAIDNLNLPMPRAQRRRK